MKLYGAKLLKKEEREVKEWACFLHQGSFSSFLPHKCRLSTAEVSYDKETHHLITSRTSDHPDLGDFLLSLKYLLIPPLLKTEVLRPPLSCQISPKAPKNP